MIDEYFACEYFSREVKVLKRGEAFKIQLADNDEYRLYIFIPLKDGYAPTGRNST